MSEFVLRRFTDYSLKKLVKKRWHSFLGISELALYKLLILAQKRLLYFKDDKIESLIGNYTVQKTGLVKTSSIVFYAIFLHCQYTLVMLYIGVKCYFKNRQTAVSLNNILLTSKQLFFGDLARSFQGFLDISRTGNNSNLICILAPFDYKQNLALRPNEIYYSSGNSITFLTFFKSLIFLAYKGFSFVRQNKELATVSTRDFALFLLDFSRNIYFIKFGKKISKKTNKNTLIILRDDAYYAPIIDAYNDQKNPTIHVIHGTSNNDELSTVPSLATNIFCGGNREVNIFKNWLNPANVFDVAAPLQVVEKDNIIKNITASYPYDLVFLASLNLKWIHKIHCDILKQSDRFLKNRNLLIRHSPSSLPIQREMIEAALSNFELSKNKKLIDDIACSEIILCASEDCLQTCLMNYKQVIYFPDLEPNLHYYAGSFSNRLENLVVVANAEELENAILKFEKRKFIVTDKEKYDQELLNIFGEIDINKIIVNFNNAFEKIHLNMANV